MNLITPAPALMYGFVNETTGTHGSRTIMLKELRLLFAACPRPTTYEQFRAAIVGDNALLKSVDAYLTDLRATIMAEIGEGRPVIL